MQQIIKEEKSTYTALKRRSKSIKSFAEKISTIDDGKYRTMFFYTLVVKNGEELDIRRPLDLLKKLAKYYKYKVTGYHWVLEVTTSLETKYHICVVIPKIHIRNETPPKWTKLNGVMPKKCKVILEKTDIHNYIKSHLEKGFSCIIGKRMYGRSINQNN